MPPASLNCCGMIRLLALVALGAAQALPGPARAQLATLVVPQEAGVVVPPRGAPPARAGAAQAAMPRAEGTAPRPPRALRAAERPAPGSVESGMPGGATGPAAQALVVVPLVALAGALLGAGALAGGGGGGGASGPARTR
jgi:hypothetical protein